MHRSSTQLADIREDLADFGAALAESSESEWRRKRGAGAALGLQRDRNRLARELRQRRLRIERVDVRAAAVHEQVQDALRLCGQRRFLAAPADCIDASVGAKQRCQAPRLPSHAAALQHLASGDKQILVSSSQALLNRQMRTRSSRATPARSAPKRISGCGAGPAKSSFAFQVCSPTLITGAQLKPSFSGSCRASTMKSIVSPFSTAIPLSCLRAGTVHRPRCQLAMPAGHNAPANSVAIRHRRLAVTKRSFDVQLPGTGLTQRRTTACSGCSPGFAARGASIAFPNRGAGSVAPPCQRSET